MMLHSKLLENCEEKLFSFHQTLVKLQLDCTIDSSGQSFCERNINSRQVGKKIMYIAE